MKHLDKFKHDNARKALQSALDGSLDEDQLKALDQHLAECDDCRAYALEMTKLENQLGQSLQRRWPQSHSNESELASTLAEIQPQVRKNQMKTNFSNFIRNLGWAAVAVLLVVGLAWAIKTLAPIPALSPVDTFPPTATETILQQTEIPVPTVQMTPVEAPTTPTAAPLPEGAVSLFPNVEFTFASELPVLPDQVTVYRQQLSEAVTVDSARQVAAQWGINGGVYASPSEGMNEIIFDVMDGTRSMRFLNFPDQFIYQVDYSGPDFGSALMDNGPLPSFEDQVAIATNFLQPLGILDLPYRTELMETERGMVAFIPLLDGRPVIQEIGVDRSNIGWIDVKVNSTGRVTVVQYSHHDFQPVGDYPILNAQQAWERFASDTSLQHSRYAVLSPEQPNTYQGWVRSYQPGENVDLYGYVNAYQPADASFPAVVMINNLVITGDTASLSPTNPYDVRFIHVWGQIEPNATGGIALSMAGWENSSLTDEYITGTIQTQGGQMQLVAIDRTLALVDPPANIPEGTQVGIQGIVLEGNPPTLDWKFIDTGQIPFSYGYSSSCGGGGGGGGSTLDANFGGGGFAFTNFDPQTAPIATQAVDPYHAGDEITAAIGTIYVTQHLYLGGRTSIEVNFWPDASAGLAPYWSYSLTGDNLSGIEQYQQLPIRIWGQVDRLENGIVFINVDRYEPEYPGVQIQEWSGTEQVVTLDGQEVVQFTTSNGENYVLKSSIDWGAEGNIIGILGNLIEIEGYIIPDQWIGGYSVLKDTAGSTQPDGVVTSAQVSVWDHTQDPGSDPGAFLQGQVTIDHIELAYDAINLDRCQASAAEDPNLSSYLYVQPMWVFNGHFDDGRRFIVQVQALPEEYLR